MFVVIFEFVGVFCNTNSLITFCYIFLLMLPPLMFLHQMFECNTTQRAETTVVPVSRGKVKVRPCGLIITDLHPGSGCTERSRHSMLPSTECGGMVSPCVCGSDMRNQIDNNNYKYWNFTSVDTDHYKSFIYMFSLTKISLFLRE